MREIAETTFQCRFRNFSFVSDCFDYYYVVFLRYTFISLPPLMQMLIHFLLLIFH